MVGDAAAGLVIGVLAMQGGFREHANSVRKEGASVRLVRSPADMAGLRGIVLPGGESTTMEILLRRAHLWHPLGAALSAGIPVLATCAGMILLARRIVDGRLDQRGLGLLDIAVRRNGYGRQRDSFEAPVRVAGLEGDFPGIFIRAPLIEDAAGAEVTAVEGGRPVGVRQGTMTAFTFHPELTDDLRIHRGFVSELLSA
jgi:pyridoxal 5'-phosphate synthase pdxT subunit